MYHILNKSNQKNSFYNLKNKILHNLYKKYDNLYNFIYNILLHVTQTLFRFNKKYIHESIILSLLTRLNPCKIMR